MRASLALLLCLVAGTRQITITEFEVPRSVEVGQSAELRCRYELQSGESEAELFVKWWVTPLDASKDRSQVYQRRVGGLSGEVAGHHAIEIKNNDTIVLLDLKPSDSGIYECEVSSEEEVRKHETLTVFTPGTGPQLNFSLIEDGADEDDEKDVLIECIALDVAPLPDLSLTINGAEVNMSESLDGPDENGAYDIVGSASVGDDLVIGAEVRCELFYNDTSISHPPYVDTEQYAGSLALTTTDAPEDVTHPDSTPITEPHNNSDSSRFQVSWILLSAFAVLTQLSNFVL